MTGVELTAEEVRRIQLAAQGLLGGGLRREGVPGVLRRLGAVQLDTISVLARSHELVPYARLGAVGRVAVEDAYWRLTPAGTGVAFEYWAHAACVLPIEEWPLLEFRRREFRRRGRRWHDVSPEACEVVLKRLRADGPLTMRELGGAKAGGQWWDWSEQKIAVEWLLDIGEVVCVRRDGWRRVYDLPERAVPRELLDQAPSDEECLRRLVARAGRALGVATRADLADYYRLKAAQVDSVLADSGLVPVRVAGWRQPAWADPAVLDAPVRGRHVTTLLSPFDSLLWDRARAFRVFGFDHRLEAYVPKAKRVHGYFAMPVLSGGRLIGRVDPARDKGVLVARRIGLEPWATATPARTRTCVTALATALRRAAAWVGCQEVRIEIVDPPHLAAPLIRALRAS